MRSAFDMHDRQLWAGRAEAFRESYEGLCAYPVAELLDAAGVMAGARVLDCGTGTGTAAAQAAQRGARVAAVDAQEDMVEATALRVPGADVRQAALPQLPFGDGEFDAVVGNFVINHVGDPGAALTEMRRLLRPGGRLAVTIWRDPPEPGQTLLWRSLAAAGIERPGDLPRPEAAFEQTEEGLAGLLAEAGLSDIGCDEIAWAHRADAEGWFAAAAKGVATAGTVLLRLSPEERTAVKEHYDRLAAEHVDNADGADTDGLLSLPHAALLASGTR